MSRERSAIPLQLGADAPVFPASFRQNFKAMCGRHGTKVQFSNLKHLYAYMVAVKFKNDDGSITDMKLHVYVELLAPEHDNLVCDECRIVGALLADAAVPCLSGNSIC